MVETVKHTPGDWAVGYRDPTKIYAPGKNTCDVQIGRSSVANVMSLVGSYSISQEEAEANARVMAKAPELLRAAHWMVANIAAEYNVYEFGAMKEGDFLYEEAKLLADAVGVSMAEYDYNRGPDDGVATGEAPDGTGDRA